MYRLFLVTAMAAVSGTLRCPSTSQLLGFKEKHERQCNILTTSAGLPVEYSDATSTLNSDLISNEYFMDNLSHLLQERIPERFVHAKGSGAFGYFEVTHNISSICKAKLFSEIGKRTPVAVRFSVSVLERGGIDTSREPRGFSIKFYTEDGNFDLVGFNIPIFVLRDPLFAGAFTHALKPNPATNLHDVNAFWDYITLRPEGMYAFLMIFADPGIPDGYRHMPGFSVHTYQVVNKRDENYFVRFHMMPDAGVKHLNSEKALKIASVDPDYAQRDLYNAISKGHYPSWTVSVQVLSLDDVKNAKLDVFDMTKVLPLTDYPLQQIGKFVLNRNPTNYFAEIEQLACCPGNLVPGILGAPDKIFEARRLIYRNALNYRLGVNFDKIPVNCPIRNQAFTYNRDGKPPVNDNDGDGPNYYPNSFNGPKPYVDERKQKLIKNYEDDPDNYEQAKEYYVNELSKEEQNRLVDNIVTSLKGAYQFLQDRTVKLLTIIHPDLGSRVYRGLKTNATNTLNSE